MEIVHKSSRPSGLKIFDLKLGIAEDLLEFLNEFFISFGIFIKNSCRIFLTSGEKICNRLSGVAGVPSVMRNGK